jgi:hypothetical protein
MIETLRTVRTVLQALRFVVLEVVPFGVWVYQRLSSGPSEIYWPYRERKRPL